jgi:hypothetical protein
MLFYLVNPIPDVVLRTFFNVFCILYAFKTNTVNNANYTLMNSKTGVVCVRQIRKNTHVFLHLLTLLGRPFPYMRHLSKVGFSVLL